MEVLIWFKMKTVRVYGRYAWTVFSDITNCFEISDVVIPFRNKERIKKKESEEMSEQKYSVLKLRLSLNLEETDVKDRVVLNRYGKVKQGIIREILVPADITLHAPALCD